MISKYVSKSSSFGWKREINFKLIWCRTYCQHTTNPQFMPLHNIIQLCILIIRKWKRIEQNMIKEEKWTGTQWMNERKYFNFTFTAHFFLYLSLLFLPSHFPIPLVYFAQSTRTEYCLQVYSHKINNTDNGSWFKFFIWKGTELVLLVAIWKFFFSLALESFSSSGVFYWRFEIKPFSSKEMGNKIATFTEQQLDDYQVSYSEAI